MTGGDRSDLAGRLPDTSYEAFFATCKAAGLPLFSHNYFDALRSETAQGACRGHAENVAELTLEELRAFIVWLSRDDRFGEGFWISKLLQGLPQAVLARLDRDSALLPYQPPVPEVLVFA